MWTISHYSEKFHAWLSKRKWITLTQRERRNILPLALNTYAHMHRHNRKRERELVSCCIEPSQPKRIISGLKTNFNLSPTYSFHQSLHHKSLFLKPQLKFFPQFRNANPEKIMTSVLDPIFIPRAHNGGYCIQQDDLFYSAWLHRNWC